MMKMTSHTRNTLWGLIIGNIIIFIVAMVLYQYQLQMNEPRITPTMLENLAHEIKPLRTTSVKHLAAILHQYNNRPWMTLSLSTHPKFRRYRATIIKPPELLGHFRHEGVVQWSMPLAQNQWLNIQVRPLQHYNIISLISFIVLTLAWIAALFLLNFWAIKRLTRPIDILKQSLEYAQNQQVWQPIPLAGDSDQRAIIERINALQAKVSKLLDNRTHILAAISHDLRTPLTRLKLRVEYLEGNQHYEKLLKDIADMEMMIHEKLDYFRDSYSQESSQRFDLVAMLASVCDDSRDMGAQITFSSDCKKCIFTGQLNLLRRAITNITNNANYYGNKVTVNLSTNKHAILIKIEDDGKGLTEDELEQVFKPFYRAESSRSRETGGTGLGLSIAQEIIHAHNGEIRLSNRTQGGLSVCIELPLGQGKRDLESIANPV